MKRDLSAPQIDIKKRPDQFRLGKTVDYALNGAPWRKSRYAFFIFVCEREPPGDGTERGCMVANLPADEVVPLILDWLEHHAPDQLARYHKLDS